MISSLGRERLNKRTSLPAAQFASSGYALIPNEVEQEKVRALIDALTFATEQGRQRRGGVYAIRNLIENVPLVAELTRSHALRSLVEPVLGAGCFPVRGILFDKVPQANWNVLWHQDLTIAVRERKEMPGFRSWTLKEGVPHVQPPTQLLERMVTVRLHLDPCGPENGPLRIIPGSHRVGRLSAHEIDALRKRGSEIILTAHPGDILVMRPLLLHASSSSTAPGHRRVIHIEYAADPLPGGLQWRE